MFVMRPQGLLLLAALSATQPRARRDNTHAAVMTSEQLDEIELEQAVSASPPCLEERHAGAE